ncbi:MAG: SDR family oxidoreductase [Actinobacteria bacterium]|nr:SDR family oxidoreductase [Actinomycetota bacterium]
MPLTPGTVLLTDRVAIVTGAAVGIGRATALALARFGANLAVCDRDVENMASLASEIESVGRKAVIAPLDVRDGDAVRAFVEGVAEQLGPIDVLVNNAGGGFHAGFLDVSDKGQDSLIRENFASVTNFVRVGVPCMPAHGASIVNITSIEAHRAAPGFAVYSAMKAAVANLTKTLALELGDRNIRVNAVAPDVIPTPGIGDVPVRTPLPRQGHVDDVAAAVVYLASDLSAFVTGVTLHVDGGNLAAGGWHRLDDGRFHT